MGVEHSKNTKITEDGLVCQCKANLDELVLQTKESLRVFVCQGAKK